MFRRLRAKAAAKRLSVGAGGAVQRDHEERECGVVAGRQEDCVFVGRGEGWAAAALCGERGGRRGKVHGVRRGARS